MTMMSQSTITRQIVVEAVYIKAKYVRSALQRYTIKYQTSVTFLLLWQVNT